MSESKQAWCCRKCGAALGRIVVRPDGKGALHIVKPGSLDVDVVGEAFVTCRVCGEERRWLPAHRGRKVPIDKP